jgi:bacillithiol synthase
MRIDVRTDPLGGSPLSRAIQAGNAPARWLADVPAGSRAWAAHLSAVAAGARTGWLDELAPALGEHGEALVRRAITGGGALVTTGQQTGLFGGALLTLVKALSAAALARTLEQQAGTAVVPLFWAATDDADFAEAATTWVPSTGGARELRWTHAPPAGTPMAAAPLGDTGELRRLLRHACGTVADARLLDAVDAAYHAQATAGAAYVAVLRAVLEPLGVAVIDASHPALRAAAQPLLGQAAARASDLAALLHGRAEDIVAAGHQPQVSEVPGLSLVFEDQSGIKRRLPVAEAPGWTESGALGATVLLRPVLERWLLPTAAYVAGPGELAYFAQVSVVAESLGVPAPVAVPRWSATLVEHGVQRLLDRLGITMEQVRDRERTLATLARRQLPATVSQALASLRTTVQATTASLAGAPDLPVDRAVVDGFARDMQSRLDRLERRAAAAVVRRDTELSRDIGTVHGALFPGGIRQERRLSFIPYVARHGVALLDAMLDAATDHATSIVGTTRTAVVDGTRQPAAGAGPLAHG